ncbi:hypothetical protein F9K33_12095 [bacterium]|nr:MAG: hypothetical protein F9K33_12095 [bacterium]
MNNILKYVTVFLFFILGTQVLFAQDKSYNTDALKGLKKITPEEWKSMQDKSVARQQQFKDVNTGENTAWAEKGYTVLKMNQTINLNAEVNALFDFMASGGQNAAGATTTRKRNVFKLGPGNFEIKDGVIKRVK